MGMCERIGRITHLLRQHVQRRTGTGADAQVQPDFGGVHAEHGAQLDDVAAGQAAQRLQPQPQVRQSAMGS